MIGAFVIGALVGALLLLLAELAHCWWSDWQCDRIMKRYEEESEANYRAWKSKGPNA